MCKHDKNVEIVDPGCGENTMAGLIIFILIILQFKKRSGGSRREVCDHDDCRHDGNKQFQLFDNSTLFILVLFCVACCGKVRLGC